MNGERSMLNEDENYHLEGNWFLLKYKFKVTENREPMVESADEVSCNIYNCLNRNKINKGRKWWFTIHI